MAYSPDIYNPDNWPCGEILGISTIKTYASEMAFDDPVTGFRAGQRSFAPLPASSFVIPATGAVDSLTNDLSNRNYDTGQPGPPIDFDALPPFTGVYFSTLFDFGSLSVGNGPYISVLWATVGNGTGDVYVYTSDDGVTWTTVYVTGGAPQDISFESISNANDIGVGGPDGGLLARYWQVVTGATNSSGTASIANYSFCGWQPSVSSDRELPIPPLTAPGEPTITEVTSTSFLVTWEPVAGASGYNVYISLNGRAIPYGAPEYPATFFIPEVGTVVPDTEYEIAVTALFCGGESAPSSPAAVVTTGSSPWGTVCIEPSAFGDNCPVPSVFGTLPL